jgi:chemotaxis protein CheC
LQAGTVLSELELDALTELVNIGVSRAAGLFRKMIGKQVLLSVPSIEIVDGAHAMALIGERESDALVAVRQEFQGAFTGRALLIFPQSKSIDLVRAAMLEGLMLEDASELEREALAETGNIILNGCLGSMANMLRETIDLGLPEVLRGNASEIFGFDHASGAEEVVLFLCINFSVQDRDIRGYLALLMGMKTMDALRGLVHNFIASIVDDEPAASAR